MAYKRYTTEVLKRYLENSDEENQTSDVDEESDEESQEFSNFAASSENRSSEIPETSSASNLQWKREVLPVGREAFTGSQGIQNIAALIEDGLISLNKIYSYFITDNLIDEMVLHTNNYAQLLKEVGTTPFTRMTKWKDVSREELKLFFGVIMYMGLNTKPTIEYYWKLDALYYNPLMHKIHMPYNRFILILRCWHFTEVQIGEIGEQRTHKIDPLVNKVIDNFRSVYKPSDIIVVEESKYKLHGKFNNGMKIFKACTINGYTWSYQIYAGISLKLEGLDKPGSILVKLTESLLDEGRLIVADNYFTSFQLAEYLKGRKTDLCGTLHKNKRNLPKEIVKAKLKRGQQIARQKDNLFTFLKWHDKHDVLMITTCHGDGMSKVSRKRGDVVMRPDAIIDYNEAKKGVHTSNLLVSFQSTLWKSLTWYKKIAIDLLFQVALVNTQCIYNELTDGPQMTAIQVQEHLIRHFLGPAASAKENNIPQRPSICPSTSRSSISVSGHSLHEIPRNINNKLVRKRCTGCYVKLKNQGLLARKAKQVHTECKMCKKAFCLECFNEKHA